ncbi:hypothetical protein GCM10009789_83480 [Kribbella sancticallisti]|uniref:Uncharacterized protein n=1 Tax=Kribbella sancticallisti TaxID=460087 RepID=A0ABP4QQA3_9ACTN
MNDSDKLVAVERILNSALPFEQKLSGIRVVLRVGTVRLTASAQGSTWRRDDDPDLHGRTRGHRSGRPRPPHRTDPER